MTFVSTTTFTPPRYDPFFNLFSGWPTRLSRPSFLNLCKNRIPLGGILLEDFSNLVLH